MSYILEALKKSQQERELGRVPTLDNNLYPAQEAAVRANPWSLLALGLAVLAVLIALYAALRSEPILPSPPPEEQRPVAGPGAEAPTAAAKVTDSAAEMAERSEQVPSPPSGEPVDAIEAPSPAERVVAEPPPPRRTPPPEPRNAVDARIPPRPAGPPIPEDVRAEVEAFKEEVLGVPRGGATRPGEKVPPANVPPEQLRLSPEVQARVPAFLMTVHVYDEDPAKRFVLINALKTLEGERTREGLVVEEIRPNGAVLSFQGHKFFRHR